MQPTVAEFPTPVDSNLQVPVLHCFYHMLWRKKQHAVIRKNINAEKKTGVVAGGACREADGDAAGGFQMGERNV